MNTRAQPTHLREQMEALLSEGVSAAIERERSDFVTTICGYGSQDSMRSRQQFLQDLGCHTTVAVLLLFWKYSGLLLPDNALTLPHCVQKAAEVVRCFNGLAGDCAILLRQHV